MAKTKRRKGRRKTPDCKHMHHTHCVYMTTLEALSLITAATHAVRSGYDDDEDTLEDAVNGLLDQCSIDCHFDDDGVMTLTVNPVED